MRPMRPSLVLLMLSTAAACSSSANDAEESNPKMLSTTQAMTTASASPTPLGGGGSPQASPPPLSAWKSIPGAWPVDANIMLMTDGTLLGFASNGSVYRMVPSTATGGYEESVWMPVASMHDSRLYFGSNVLPDGRVFVVGGEYGTGTNKGEVYDPVANVWSSPFSDNAADTETALLPDGRVYIAWSSTIYDPQTSTIGVGPTYPGNFDEASFVLLPDGSYLTIPTLSTQAYRYVPSSGTFVPAGTLPSGGLYDGKQEIGPGVLLASGKVFWIGGNGRTAIYTPPTGPSDPGSWVAGPSNPDGYRADDAPAVVERNGHVLFLADVGSDTSFVGPTKLYDYDPVANTISAGSTGFDGASYVSRMVALPNGQVLLSTGGAGYLYSPPVGDGGWAPTIARITPVSTGVYSLIGTNIHGFSEGSAYGDDAEMASNFPLVRFECGGGTAVFYGRTYGWEAATVGLKATVQSTQFSVPRGASGVCSLVTVANGIPSAPRLVTVTDGVVTGPVRSARETDYDGDGKTDIAVWRPSDHNWYVRNSGGPGTVTAFGDAGDSAAPADYDGDGKTDIAVWRSSSNTWFIAYSRGGSRVTPFGQQGAIPVPADYDGDGKANLAFWLPSNHTWYVANADGTTSATAWGNLGDVPVPADYDGDGKTDIAVWRPSDHNWYIDQSAGGGRVVAFGNTGDVAVPADYDGDGKTDIAVWRPSDHNWYIAYSAGGSLVTAFGDPGDITVPGDYDGDGKADIAVWRPTDHNWYVSYSAGGSATIAWGNVGDIAPVNVEADQGCAGAANAGLLGACFQQCANSGSAHGGYCAYGDGNASYAPSCFCNP